MKQHLAEGHVSYTGRELRSHWILEAFGIAGDAIVAFIGPCDVATDAMVDLADVAAGAQIRARLMLHFIVERFDTDLEKAILHQRLLVAIAGQLLQEVWGIANVRRDGDDLFCADRKLSVSIATVSPVSTLIHLGINIDPQGAPVEAIGCDELQVDAPELAQSLMAAYVAEVEAMGVARSKVRGVR